MKKKNKGGKCMKKVLALVVSLFALFFVACGKESTNATGEKVVVVSQGSKPKSLDPYMYNEIPGLAVSRQFYDTLFKREANGEIIPLLAESYEFASPTELNITLRDGVKFHNGEVLTADDVVFSLERMKTIPASEIMVSDIDKVEAVDPKTVKITLHQSSAPILYSLAHPLSSILNKKYVEEKKGNISVEPMGTGPYKFVSWGDGEKIEMLAFDDYFLGRPKIDKLIFRAIAEDSSRLAALETGEVDIAYNMSSIDAGTIENDKNLELISKPTTAVEYIGVNNTKPPFNNKEFRQALNYAIDKQSIVDSVYLGRAGVAKSIVNPNVFGYYDGVEGYSFNPEKAKELLAKSGVKDPSFTVYINENSQRAQSAQIIQANLKELGIDMKIETLEWGTYLQKSAEGDYQAFLGGWISGTSDADIVLFPLLDTKSIGSAGNRSRYSNAKFDKLVEGARSELDVAKRKDLYKEAQVILQEDTPLIVLYTKNENIGINKRIKGFEYDPTNMHSLASLEIAE